MDHGKTALVRALTGVDTDRLPEERAREISIELGFAPLTLPSGITVSVVDVPGHERFIKNMLAGATGVDVVLLVVDVGEGVRPQTEEHLDILGLLGVRTGVAALTKIDTASPDQVTAAAADLSRFLAGTSLAGAPVVPVSARTGEGLPELLAALSRAVGGVMSSRPGPRAGDAPARLAIDRAFVVAGFGTVVTGTVASGRIETGQRLELYPEGPIVRVRGLEVHGRPASSVAAGERAAVNLAGSPPASELRGLVLAEPGSLTRSTCVGLLLRLLPKAPRPKDMMRVRLHAGTSETIGRLVLLGGPSAATAPPTEANGRELAGGAPGTAPADGRELAGAAPAGGAAAAPTDGLPVAFEAERPIALAMGQACVIRSYSPAVTIAGAVVRAPDLPPLLGGRKPRGASTRLEAWRRLSAPPSEAPAAVVGGAKVDPALYREIRAEAQRRLAARHEAQPHLASVGREVLWSWLGDRGLSPAAWLEAFAADGLLRLEGGRVRLSDWRPRRDERLQACLERVETALRQSGFSPPRLVDSPGLADSPALVSSALEILLQEGVVVGLGGTAAALRGELVLHRDTVAEARRRLEDYLDQTGPITVAAFRDLIGSTRRFAVPLLEYFDREKITQRRGDLRVRHPARAPRAPAP